VDLFANNSHQSRQVVIKREKKFFTIEHFSVKQTFYKIFSNLTKKKSFHYVSHFTAKKQMVTSLFSSCYLFRKKLAQKRLLLINEGA
jgi:hypothetical protein